MGYIKSNQVHVKSSPFNERQSKSLGHILPSRITFANLNSGSQDSDSQWPVEVHCPGYHGLNQNIIHGSSLKKPSRPSNFCGLEKHVKTS